MDDAREWAAEAGGSNFFPQIFDAAVRQRPKRPLAPGETVALMVVPLGVLAVAYLFVEGALPGDHVEEPFGHGLIEGFCAVMALVLFYVLRYESLAWQSGRLALMAHGFLAYGILNFAHATALPGGHAFVLLHSVAGLIAGVLFLTALHCDRLPPSHRLPPGWLGSLAVAVALVAAAALGSHLARFVAMTNEHGTFSAAALVINLTAAVLFLAVGVTFLGDFRRTREPVLFAFALGMLLFADMHAMFSLSQLWDLHWWAWHALKAVIFLMFLLGLAHQFAAAVREMVESRGALIALNAALREQNRRTDWQNRELRITHERLAATQASLIEAEKLATLGQIAAMVAHEIRNPLGTLANCIGLLRRGMLAPAETAEIAGLMESQVDHVESIVRDTLASARLRSARHEPVDLAILVDDVLRGLAPAQLGDVHLVARVAPDLPLLLGNGQQLRQMVWNLVVNALDALAGAGELRIELDSGRGGVILTIADSGPGIAAAVRDRLFEPFITTKPEGTGLGLAMVRRTAGEHGATVEVASDPGRGAAFIVRFRPAQHFAESGG